MLKNEREQAYYGNDDIPIPSPIHQRADEMEREYAYFNTDYDQTSNCSHDISFSFK